MPGRNGFVHFSMVYSERTLPTRFSFRSEARVHMSFNAGTPIGTGPIATTAKEPIMTKFIKKSVLATALAATALAGSAPAMADGYYGGYHHGGDGTGAAVAAGIFGLALGAILVSSAHHHDRYDDRVYVDRRYYPAPYVEQRWVWHDGYYWDHEGNRYGRDGRYYGYGDGGYARRDWDHRDGGDYGDRQDYRGYRGY